MSATSVIVPVAGQNTEIWSQGEGTPLLFLHPGIGTTGSEPMLARLAREGRVIAPSHPGFGRSDLPTWFDTVDDLALFYLDLMEKLDLRDVTLIGADLGGWIAAEVAVRSTERISRLVLSGAVGIRVNDRDTPDLVDVYSLPRAELDKVRFLNPDVAKVDPAALSDDDARIIARNREAEALFAWSPYMHNPKLARWLHRIRVPTLVLWGEEDKLAPLSYGRAFADAIPGARFETIAQAGHYPHIEQPGIFAGRIAAFAAGAALERAV